MAFDISTFTVTMLALIMTLSFFVVRYYWSLSQIHGLQAEPKHVHHDLIRSAGTPAMVKLTNSLASALPGTVISPDDGLEFQKSINFYLAQQENEVIPACVVRPRNSQQLCTAVAILKREYDERERENQLRGQKEGEGLFAIRGGGHSPVSGAASIKGGVMIDLSHFAEVEPSEDGSSVAIGAGAKWGAVSKVLDAKGLAVVGGRNSDVGVGGLTLGGGLSFFSPRFGMACSNVISYEVVLASGSITTASESNNPDLWRCLKGGSNNFGIVTRFTVRSFPAGKIWSGFLYMPSFQHAKVLAAFHESVNKASLGGSSRDDHAAGALTSFSYVQQIGMQLIAANLVYTKTPEDEKNWPTYWKKSSFASLWRFWSTCKTRTLTSATDELNALNPPGKRQLLATTTIKNDPATLTAVHDAYIDAITSIRRVNVKGMVWTLVLQPFLPDWTRKGDPNPLGLGEGKNDPLVNVSFTVNWDMQKDDEVVHETTRQAIEEIDIFAAANATGHRFRYLNYCARWQKPFESYGEDNVRFLQEVSRKYDPDRLFQRGCVGGFKLDDVGDQIRTSTYRETYFEG
jgi:hypothetical protein